MEESEFFNFRKSVSSACLLHVDQDGGAILFQFAADDEFMSGVAETFDFRILQCQSGTVFFQDGKTAIR